MNPTSLPRYNARRILNTAYKAPQRRAFSSPSPTSLPNSPARLSGRTCMITGGTSGIGFAIAQRFLQEGAEQIILVGRSYPRLITAANKLSTPTSPPPSTAQNNESPKQGSLIQTPHQIRLLVGDISDAGTWARELENAMLPVDILVNAAGISHSSILPKTSATEISQILRTNLEGAIFTSRALLRAAVRNRLKAPAARPASKCIINISSLLALKGGTGAVPYAASKAGILGLTRSVAVEAAGSLRDVVVRSNAIVPGYIETPMIAEFSEGQTEGLKGRIPLRRFGVPGEVADAAVFLAGNEYANNCVLNLDGGLSAV
ncbi:hypothetical protein BDV28DRAFT_109970 [Aspergillus coremiiformis]|uniref:Ketoreductase domain-containing protein n=1 Tax=Aspergillus coremiiformis TaxID=138285 RepID=A0A5N6ZF77_9EURO|nr:hypothetical protein BDV28DRAFT_109970 [Aspergillus coremiiformis]